MKRYVLFIMISILMFLNIDVYACGEIIQLRSTVGTVRRTDASNFLVYIPKGTDSLILEASSDYPWVKGFAPGRYSTDKDVTIKVDGTSCGGIYTYTVKFKKYTNLIAENIPSDPLIQTPPTPDPGTETVPPQVMTEPTTPSELLLESLKIKEADIEFDPSVHEYELEVEGDVSKLTIDAKAKDSSSIVTISKDAEKLEEGKNIVEISLIDTNGNTGRYTIIVDRLKQKSDNNFLASLSIEGYQLNFDPSTTEYVLNVGKVSSLKVTATTESKEATYVVLGNNNISDGSKVTVQVTAEDGSQKDYVITIKVVFNIMDYWIYVVIVMLVLLLLIIMIITKQKKNKKKLGPEVIEGNQNTAGVIQEIASQNSTAGTVTEVNQNGVEANASNGQEGASVLQIIEPTNIETAPQEEPTEQASSDDESTEIFQL